MLHGNSNSLTDQTLIDKFIDAIQSSPDDARKFPLHLSRALLYWPIYVELINIILLKDIDVSPLVASVTSVLKEPINEAAEKEGGADTVNWTDLLCLMLTICCKINGSHLYEGLYKFYEQKAEDESGYRQYQIKIGFYYRFAATFQNWIIYHSEVDWYKKKQDISAPDMCKECKAHITNLTGKQTHHALYLLYQNILKTRSAFRAIFGCCAYEIGTIYHQLPDFRDKVKNRLFGEFVSLMKEVESLAHVHARVHLAHRIIENALNNSASDKKDLFDENLKKWIFDNLKIAQLTLFVRNFEHKIAKDQVAFDSTKQIEKKLGIRIPEKETSIAYKEKYNTFLSVLEGLYSGAFDKNFFTNIKKTETSATDSKRTFPFILIPDGEVNFYYALAMACKNKQLRLNNDNIDKSIKDHAEFWDKDAWWETREKSGGMFPDDGQSHDRCAALLATAYMCMDDQKNRLRNYSNQLEVIRDKFCRYSNNFSAIEDPQNCIEDFLKDCTNQNFKDIIKSARISFLPEILLRAGDNETSTLFFLPVGWRDNSETEETKVPLAMIAGTLKGVEKRWLPFNSYRIVAHLYPLARILQPLIDRMSQELYMEGALSKQNEAIHKKIAEDESNKSKMLQANFTAIDHHIIELTKAANRIRKEIFPAPRLFCEDRSIASTLSGLFFPEQPRKINLKKELVNIDKFKEEAKSLGELTGNGLGLSENYEIFVASHSPDTTFAHNTTEGAKYARSMLLILKWYFDNSITDCDINKYMFEPLFEITQVANCISVLKLLKDYIHYSQIKKEVTPWLFFIPIVLESYSNKRSVAIKINNESSIVPMISPNYVWQKIISLEHIESKLHEKFTYNSSSWLINALYGLFCSSMKPGQVGTYASITEIGVENLDLKKEAFELVLVGEGGFASEHVFFLDHDDASRDLRSNIRVFSDAVGVELPTIYRVGKRRLDPNPKSLVSLNLSKFSIVQWSVGKTHKFRMSIRIGEKT